MANRRLPMRKIKEILRLHFQARLSARQIARSCSVSRATVGEYLNRTRAVQLDWKQVAQMSEAELEGQLFPPPAPRGRHRSPPDFAYVHRELRAKSVTLQLLWQGVQTSSSGRLPVLAVLRSVQPLERKARRGAAAKPPGRREDVCRLCRPDGRDRRSQDR